jgi:hypothetical protein
MKMKTWFQAFAFEWVNLCRYATFPDIIRALPGYLKEGVTSVVGLYNLNPVDPQLETAWFPPLHLSSENLVSNLFFKFNKRLVSTLEPMK